MASTSVIDDYVTGLGRTLRGPLRAKRDLIAEARDGLVDATEALEADGLPRQDAERLAVEEFGPIAAIAPAYQEELAVGQGRRTALLLFIGVPFIALVWSMIWRIFPQDPARMMAHWPGWFHPVSRVVDYSQIAVGLCGAAALIAFGPGRRRLARPWLVTRALGVLVWVELPLIGVLSSMLTTAAALDGFSSYPPGAAATLVTGVFMLWQLYSATRCLIFTPRSAA
ncbi:permease prefix domain 1-containing protein [Microtetraspora niveoalba]|uniref:permease prefix domain 1-containing protein n=1 Tax=Microtetraspora niveoalba TaxID=46175 RepID=UPI00082CDD5B|nr:permease prefix domain 1-containing protein [Microtetraspora niveoalba]